MKLTKDTILSYENFNNLTNDIILLAKEVMPDKVIYINFLNEDVQVTMKVSSHDTLVNITEGETISVENAICNNIDYKNKEPLILEDIHANNFNENINKTIKNLKAGSYIGIPIVFKNGKRFGALCASHHDKSSFKEKDIKLLQKIANLFSYYLELEHMVYKDSLTNLENLDFLKLKEKEIIHHGGLALMLDLDNFKLVNDTLGHFKGDLVLIEVGEKLQMFIEKFKYGYAIRTGGDEFFLYIKDDLTKEDIIYNLDYLVTMLSTYKSNIKNINLSVSIGSVNFKNNEYKDFNNLYRKIDKLLYKAKESGKNKFVLSYSKKEKDIIF